jgi:hypothetical protein
MASIAAHMIGMSISNKTQKKNNTNTFKNYNKYPDKFRPNSNSPKMDIYSFILLFVNWIIFAIAMILALKCGTFGHIVAGCCCSPFYIIYRIVYPC